MLPLNAWQSEHRKQIPRTRIYYNDPWRNRACAAILCRKKRLVRPGQVGAPLSKLVRPWTRWCALSKLVALGKLVRPGQRGACDGDAAVGAALVKLLHSGQDGIRESLVAPTKAWCCLCQVQTWLPKTQLPSCMQSSWSEISRSTPLQGQYQYQW